jgi:carbon-monoxide dehydrogenase medium subunit
MSIQFQQPESIPETLELLSEYGYDAKVIAGGTAVVLMMQQKLIAPQMLVSLARIPGLEGIWSDEDGIHLGAFRRIRDVAQSPLIRDRLPMLADACQQVGNVRVRNQATIGGNMAEADYASDPPAVLLALNASVTLAGVEGTRTVPLSEFFLGFYTTALREVEIITEIVVPAPPQTARMIYLKFKSRSSEDRPCVGVAALSVMDGETCSELRLAVGAASEVPVRLHTTEALAHGRALDDALIAEIAEHAATQIEPLNDLRGSAWYRTQMIRVHVKRALLHLRNDG